MKVTLRWAQTTAVARGCARGNPGPLIHWFSNNVRQVLWQPLGSAMVGRAKQYEGGWGIPLLLSLQSKLLHFFLLYQLCFHGRFLKGSQSLKISWKITDLMDIRLIIYLRKLAHTALSPLWCLCRIYWSQLGGYWDFLSLGPNFLKGTNTSYFFWSQWENRVT